MVLKLLICLIFLIGFTSQPLSCLASSLQIKIDSPTKFYTNPNLFKLAVTIYNTGEQPFVVFPAYTRRVYKPLDEQSFQYSPYPGPVIDPWYSAISLELGHSQTLTFNGMQDRDGVWNLTPGRYELSVSLNVLPNSYYSLSPSKNIEGIDIWHGEIESKSIYIKFFEQK